MMSDTDGGCEDTLTPYWAIVAGAKAERERHAASVRTGLMSIPTARA